MTRSEKRKPAPREWTVWIYRGDVRAFQSGDIAAGHVAVFPPCTPSEKTKAPWPGLVRAVLRLDPPRRKRK